jgi:hypothetical protein
VHVSSMVHRPSPLRSPVGKPNDLDKVIDELSRQPDA